MATREQDMAAYDQLPPAIRSVLQVTPLNLDADFLLRVVSEHGQDQAVNLIRQSFPGWRPR